MSDAFRGEFTQRVDGKARVSIPAAFRRVLEAGDPDSTRKRIVMVYGDTRRKYTECYTMAGAAALNYADRAALSSVLPSLRTSSTS